MPTDRPDASPYEPSPQVGEQRLIDFLSDSNCGCPLCGYNLRGLTSSSCPECGQQLQLTVGLTDLLLWPWASMAVTTCLCAGLGFMCVFMLVLKGMPPSIDSKAATLIRDCSIYGFMSAIPIAAVVIIKRRAILRLNAATQKRLAWLCIGGCITLFAAFFITMAITVN